MVRLSGSTVVSQADQGSFRPNLYTVAEIDRAAPLSATNQVHPQDQSPIQTYHLE